MRLINKFFLPVKQCLDMADVVVLCYPFFPYALLKK